MKLPPNPAPAVDGGIPLQYHIAHAWPAATEERRPAYTMRTSVGSNHLMKNIIALTIAASVLVLAGCCRTPQAKTWKETYSSFDLASEHPARDRARQFSYNTNGVPLDEVLRIYEELSGRTVIAGQLPDTKIDLRAAAPLSRIEALQMLDSVLAQNHIAMVLSGDKAVKAVPAEKASSESPPEITMPWRLLPESSSMMSRTVRLQNLKPSETMAILQPLAKLPYSILPIDSQRILLLRDYSSNIRQQLKFLEELEQKESMK